MKRRHRAHPLLAPWAPPERLRGLVDARSLAVARFEPAVRQMDAWGALDLTFERAGEIAVVPLVMVDCAMIAEPEDDALIWPEAAAEAVAEEALEAISQLVVPWLRARAMTHGLHSEAIRVFSGGEGVRAFERARAYGFTGAAPYERVACDAAPCAYAVRFLSGAERAGVRYAAGGGGAALLAAHGAAVRADLGEDDRNAAARVWFGLDAFARIEANERFDVCIGDGVGTRAEIRIGEVPPGFTRMPVARPVPFSVLFSFDEADGDEVAVFGVRAVEARAPRAPRFGRTSDPVGGSAGRILIGIRKDAQAAPDADVDDAIELARRLRAEGFSVDVLSHLAPVHPRDYDLIHAFGLIAAEDVQWLLERARTAGRPTVLTPALEDVTLRGVWGTGVAQYVLTMTPEERELSTYLHHLARHNLSIPGLQSNARHEPRTGFEKAARAALAASDAVLAAGDAEEALLRTQYGYSGPVLRSMPYLNAETAAEEWTERAGFGEYVLCHAPIEPRCNQALLVRAAREAGVPLVLAGPVADAAYFELVREHAGDVRFVPEPDANRAAALYGRARVFADAAWIGFGLRRIAQAAAYGCRLAVANLRYAGALWRPGLWEFEPASVASIAQALREAWDGDSAGRRETEACAQRVAAQCDPVLALVGTVSAYAQAQAPRLNSAASPADI